MDTSHVRNVAPMIARRRALADLANETNAIQALLKLGWRPTVTEHGMTLIAPPERATVNAETANA